MNEARAARPPAASGAARAARVWAGALGRLLLFGILFVAFTTFVGVLTFMWDARDGWAIVKGGLIWLVAALVAGAFVLRWLDRRSWRALGIAPTRAALRASAIGIALGVAMILLAVALMLLTGDLTFARDHGTVAAALGTMATSFAVLLLPAAADEAVFRGYPIQVLARAGGAPLAVLTTSAAFAAVHAGNPEIGTLALTNIFLAGVLLGVVYLRTASLWAATAVHLGWNWGMAGLFDLPVSGLGWIQVPAFEPVVSGPGWWNGGAFGPEGGVIGTIVFVGATVVALRTRWLARPLLEPEDRLLCDTPIDADADTRTMKDGWA